MLRCADIHTLKDGTVFITGSTPTGIVILALQLYNPVIPPQISCRVSAEAVAMKETSAALSGRSFILAIGDMIVAHYTLSHWLINDHFL